jgi:hypothetical protein
VRLLPQAPRRFRSPRPWRNCWPWSTVNAAASWMRWGAATSFCRTRRKQLQLTLLAKNPFEQQLLEEQRKSRTTLEKLLQAELERGRRQGFTVGH